MQRTKNNQNTGIEQEGEEEMKCLFTVEGKGAVYYFDGQSNNIGSSRRIKNHPADLQGQQW